jgi:hypothetical protein
VRSAARRLVRITSHPAGIPNSRDIYEQALVKTVAGIRQQSGQAGKHVLRNKANLVEERARGTQAQGHRAEGKPDGHVRGTKPIWGCEAAGRRHPAPIGPTAAAGSGVDPEACGG